MKTILLGLDGATWENIRPWAEEGLMPNFKKAFEMGAWGDLRSTVPPTTPPAWATTVTGKNPGKHGIYDFRESFLRDPRRPIISGRSIRAKKIWHILNQHGKKAGVMNVPITFPPEEVDGFMISGMMTPSPDHDYTYPKELKAEIKKAVGDYVPNIDIPQYDVELLPDALRFFKDMRYCFEKRRDAFFWLLENKEWDFFMPVFVITDRIGHLFWKYLSPESKKFYNHKNAERIREEVRDCYRMVDDMFGALLEKLDDDTTLFVMSDHGFGYTYKWINVNRFLKDIGVLNLKGGTSWKKSLFFTVMQWNDSRLVKALIPDAVQSAIRNKIRKGRGTLKTDVDSTIDWSRTKAFFASIPTQGIFINIAKPGVDGIVQYGREYNEVREFIRDELYKIKDPDTGEQAIQKVIFREEVYEGPEMEMAPDILFVAHDYGYLGRQLFGAKKWIESSENLANGFHRMNGVFMAIGKHIKPGFQVEGAGLEDIAPTLLHTMGFPVPEDMDGSVLTSILKEDWLESNPVRTVNPELFADKDRDVYSAEEEDVIKDRLAGLGYIE
jgi:predicted AlkP superfamily phosphohydrolase/phosphomutase